MAEELGASRPVHYPFKEVTMPDHELGCYTGQLILKPLQDGRRMQTVLDFGFREADGLYWPVPRGATVDGASIPAPLWQIIGSPWVGKISRRFGRAALVRPRTGPRKKLS